MTDHPVTLHCVDCDSTDIVRGAHAAWNPELQTYEIAGLHDDWFCETCQAETRIAERPVPVPAPQD